jgi:hypothetical protein
MAYSNTDWEMSKMRTIHWIRFPPDWGGPNADEVVWILVRKLESSWQLDTDYYVGAGGTGKAISGRYEKFEKWLALGEPVWMASVVIDDGGEITFSDGRHRFAWLRDHGVVAIPVQVPPEQAEIISKRFGTTSRISLIPIADSSGLVP